MKISSVLIAMALFAFADQSFAEVLRCKGSVEWGKMDVQVKLDIVLPEKVDAVAAFPAIQGQEQMLPVGRGRIDVQESYDDQPVEKRTYDLFVTSLDTGIVTGFIVSGNQIYVLRLSPRAKSFSYFDSFLERLVVGSCA